MVDKQFNPKLIPEFDANPNGLKIYNLCAIYMV